MPWRSIDSAPKDGTNVLLIGRYTDGPRIGYWVDSPGKPFSYTGWTTGWETANGHDVGYDPIHKPSHWLPIPPEPKFE